MVQFAALLYGPDEDIRSSEMADLVVDMKAFRSAVGDRMVGGAPFLTTNQAVTVRVTAKGGDLVRENGPYADTPDALGGLFVFECDTIEEAVELARRIPNAWNGAVEVRPLVTSWK